LSLLGRRPDRRGHPNSTGGQDYPQFWNAYDSLGEAYLKAGQKEPAIQNYQKSVDLNPQNQGGVEALKKLRPQK
jgi:tetratricopeptide (TPR) repeat protein